MQENSSILVSAELKAHYDDTAQFLKDLKNPEKSILTKNSDIVAAINAVTRVLTTLTKQLTEAHNSENFAAMKMILISTLKDTDTDTSTRFLNALKEKRLL
ncbi:hypothetical protein KAU11_08400 [Candidatus Babeliales bacterium]|nr:hypothetical protein [Candidatus Babeliales bacterium]